MTYKIDKGISVPPPRNLSRKQYPFDKMAKGDSFYVEASGVKKVRSAAAWWNKNYGREKGVKLVTRKERDGVRVWLVAADGAEAE